MSKDFFCYSHLLFIASSLRRTLVLWFLILAPTLIMFGLASCKNHKEHEKASPAAASTGSTTYYTCSMHPQVNEPKPGKCPICGMGLIAVQKTATKADELQLNDEQIKLGNISVDTIENGALGDEVVLNATINFNQEKIATISSRVMGRIEQLYFKNIGDYISKGDKLFDIYSEELNSAKQEYMLAIERQNVLDNSIIDFNQLIQSAKNKLLLWGLSERQIAALSKTKTSSTTTTFYSNGSGYITTLDIREGDYVMEGGTIVHLADLSSLWVEAQVYTSELSRIDKNDIAFVQIPDIQYKEIKGKIEFVNPEINAETRINLLRITVPNQNNQLKPGMSAYVRIKSRQRNALSVPIDAVIRDAKGATVWIKTGNNTFKSKMVDVGIESSNRIEIRGGLKMGDIVVVTGAYLINSEYIFKKGVDPMAGMKM